MSLVGTLYANSVPSVCLSVRPSVPVITLERVKLETGPNDMKKGLKISKRSSRSLVENTFLVCKLRRSKEGHKFDQMSDNRSRNLKMSEHEKGLKLEGGLKIEKRSENEKGQKIEREPKIEKWPEK